MDQKNLSNLLLNGFQYLIRDGQIAIASTFLGEFRLVIVLAQVITDGIKRLGTDAEIPFKGGKLPVYDHETSLPFLSGTIQ